MAGIHYAEPTASNRLYQPHGAALQLMYCKDPIVLIEGPAGTGKSRAVLEKGFILMDKYPGCRGALFRKTRHSLSQTSMVTFETKVCPPGFIHFNTTDQQYEHPNGSILSVGGLDKPSKIMSSEYDFALVPEATEITEDDMEMILTRLRNGVIPFQQLILDCNPAGPLHWLNLRCKDKGKDITRLKSKHKDNPVFWDAKKGDWTKLGRDYLTRLKNLSGVRFWRYFKGVWRQAEGVVLEEWDERIHLIDRREIPDHWPRYWSVDFGYTDPFVWLDWAIDPDGRAILVNQIYHSKKLVADHAKTIFRVTNNIAIRPRACICDWDAEGRATLERELGIRTQPAYKESIIENIEAMRRRLRKAGDGYPRLMVMRDSLVEEDPELKDRKLPVKFEEEPEGYIWEEKTRKERPKDGNDHGINAAQYLVGHIDKLGTQSGDVEQRSAH